MIVAFLAALVGTVGYGTATVLQAAGAQRAEGLAVMRQPLYLAGLALDGVAWLGSLLALQRLPLFAVQALLAGSLCITVILARIFLGTRFRVRDGAAIIGVALALVVLAAAAGVESALPAPRWFTLAVLVSLAVVVVVTVGLYRAGRPMPMAVLAGVGFSGAALCARALHIPRPWFAIFADPLAWAIVGFGVIGAVALSRALEHGAVGPATAVLWVVEVVLPSGIGVALLGDTVRPGWAVAAVLAIIVAVAGCTVLATSPSQPRT